MNHLITPLLTFLLALASANFATAQDEQHNHDQHAAAHSGELDLARPESGKWASDKSLRQGMSELKAAFEPHHAAYQSGDFDARQAAELADTIQEKVNFMIAHCNLPTAADAELHKLLAAALGAAQTLRESDDQHEGLHQLHRVLLTYPEFFDHPDWTR